MVLGQLLLIAHGHAKRLGRFFSIHKEALVFNHHLEAPAIEQLRIRHAWPSQLAIKQPGRIEAARLVLAPRDANVLVNEVVKATLEFPAPFGLDGTLVLGLNRFPERVPGGPWGYAHEKVKQHEKGRLCIVVHTLLPG